MGFRIWNFELHPHYSSGRDSCCWMGRMGRMFMGLWDEGTILGKQWDYGATPCTCPFEL